MSKFTKAALELRNQGFNVIPFKPGSKEPLVPWKQYQNKRPTDKKIEEWGGKWPDANIGILTGKISDVIAVDIDGPRGEKEIKKKGGFPQTPCSKTQKGYHYLFRHPGFLVVNKPNKQLQIDIKGDGGLVVAPPSIHPSGHQYSWIVSPFEVEPAGIPQWLEDYIKQRSSQSDESKDLRAGVKGHVKSDKKLWTRSKKIIRQYPEIAKWFKTRKSKDRSGHDWRLVRLCLEHGIEEDDLLYQILLNNKYGKARAHPNTDEYITDCIRRARHSHNLEEFLIPASELMKEDFDEDYSIIGEGILNTSSSLILGGESGTWKTTLALEWALRLVSGKPILGLPVKKVDGVIILQTENTLPEIQERLRIITAGLGLKKVPSNMYLSREGKHFCLTNENHILLITKLIKNTGAEILILDPLLSFHNEQENDNVRMNHVLGQVTRILRPTGAAAIIIHHYGKPTEKRGYHKLRGASSIVGWTDTVLGVSHVGKRDSGRLRIQFQRVRYGPDRDDILLERDKNFIHTAVSETSPCPPEKIVEILRKDFKGVCKKKGDLEKRLAKKLRCSTKTAGKYVADAAKAGAIRLIQDGNTKRVEIVKK